MSKIISGFLIVLLIVLLGCNSENEKKNEPVKTDIDEIRERGKLIALTGYNAYSYFIYKGQPMGYEYELVEKLGKFLGVEVEFKIVKDLDKMFEMLDSGEGDLIAFNLTVTKERTKRVNFTHYHHTTRQVLIQRKPDNWRNLMRHQIEMELIKNPIDLVGKNITIKNGSAYAMRLENLSEEIGGDINITMADPELSTDDLIQLVSEGKIEYTVADENVARLNHVYYPNIDFKTEISLPQRIAWAVRKNNPNILAEINIWIEMMRNKTEYYVIYNKYFKRRNAFKNRRVMDYFTNLSGKISEYDEEIKKYAREINWDWRILTSQIYQESKFNPEAKSWAGAVGLMQLMPATLKQYNVKNPLDPMENLRGGMKHIAWLDKYWTKYIPDKDERIKFVLASYNIGLGHITDARNLTIKFKADSTKWFGNVEEYLLKKSKAKFYNDEVVEYGYCRGEETVSYVKQVLERYAHYRSFMDFQQLTSAR